MNNFAKKMMLAATLYHIFAISYYTCHSDSLFSFLKKKKECVLCFQGFFGGKRRGGGGMVGIPSRGGSEGCIIGTGESFRSALVGILEVWW